MIELPIAIGTEQTQNYFCLDYQSKRGYITVLMNFIGLISEGARDRTK